jgi:hypothetical protein
MKTWKAIWAFLNSRIFVVILIAVLILIGVGQCKRIVDLNRDIDHHEQNQSALTDSLKFERKKNGELLVSIDGYIATEKELKNLNKKLWDEVQGQKGKVLSLTNTVIRLQQDSADLAEHVDELNVIIGKLKQIGDKYAAPWTIPTVYDDKNFFRVSGVSVLQVLNKEPFEMRHDTTYLTSFINQIDVTYGTKVEGKKLRVFIESKYPGFTVESMEGVLLDPSDWPSIVQPEKRHWFTGFGVGPELSMGWDFLQSKPSLVVGIGIHYNIYQW